MALNPGAETYSMNLQKAEGQSWGFRLQGGKDFTTPLSIQMVNPGSLAEQYGLKTGDAILSINSIPSDELTHDGAKQEIVRSGNQVTMLIQRGMVKIWKPTVTPMSELRPGQVNYAADDPAMNYVQKTSLAADKGDFHNIGSAHNRTARPFPGFGGGSSQPAPPPVAPPAHQGYGAPSGGMGGQYGAPPGGMGGGYGAPPAESYSSPGAPSYGVNPVGDDSGKSLVHAQYNSPIGMYSGDNIAETYTAQASALNQDMQHLSVSDNPPRTVSPTLLAVQQDGQKTTPERKVSSGVSPTLLAVTQEDTPPGRVQRGVSPTLQAVMRDQEKSQNNNWTDNGSNAFKQSRSFKLLEQNLNDSEVGAITGRPTGTRSVQAPVTKPPSERKEAQHMTCGACGMLCTGVFVRIKGVPMHPECFKCVKCGVGLKNKGYFHIEDKLYCEVHARQVAKPPAPDMVAVPVYR